jgi:phenylpropionate dioxygenase-like ring-hydroxylating dioxygenase large terminal subunit
MSYVIRCPLVMQSEVERLAGEGKCTEIPQLPVNGCAARTRASPAACATAFPAAVSDGMLFVWMVPGADGLLQSSQCAPLGEIRL